MLHEITYGSGVGFCGAALPSLLPADYHGPLVIALDSNILIDMQDYGAYLVDDRDLPEAVASDPRYVVELDALATLLNLWMLRDIRFIVTGRARSDGKRIRDAASAARRHATIDAIADSLMFQTEAWGVDLSLSSRDSQGLPDDDLVAEAGQIGAHVFLTRDSRLVARYRDAEVATSLLQPRDLTATLAAAGVALIGGGLCAREGCPYGDGHIPAPDMGKWGPLLSVLGD